MAEFSKQYCEIFNNEFPFDFDIEEISNDLQPEHYTPITCEGFGFIAIGKNERNETILAFPLGNHPDSEVEWKTLNDLLNGK